MCRGSKIVFLQFVGVSKQGFSKKNQKTVFAFVFVMLEEKKRKDEANEKEHFRKKKQKNSVFGWL